MCCVEFCVAFILPSHGDFANDFNYFTDAEKSHHLNREMMNFALFCMRDCSHMCSLMLSQKTGVTRRTSDIEMYKMRGLLHESMAEEFRKSQKLFHSCVYTRLLPLSWETGRKENFLCRSKKPKEIRSWVVAERLYTRQCWCRSWAKNFMPFFFFSSLLFLALSLS